MAEKKERQIGPNPSNALRLFEQADLYFSKDENREKMTPEVIDRITQMLEHVRENPELVLERARQLDQGVNNFNAEHLSNRFHESKINAIKLSKELDREAQLPLISATEIPEDADDFFGAFGRRISRGYYTFVESLEDSPKLMNHMITAMLVDGYGLAVKTQNFVESGEVLNDITIVNAICEEVDPGVLQDEIFETDWYNPKWGFSDELFKQVEASYEARH